MSSQARQYCTNPATDSRECVARASLKNRLLMYNGRFTHALLEES